MKNRSGNGEQASEAPTPPAVDARQQFRAVAPLYDALMNDVPYHGWMDYIARLLDLRAARPKTVLDLACGTGNVSELFCQEGYEVSGVDIAAGMIAEARGKASAAGMPIDYFVQDAADLNLPGLKFDLCVSLFDSLNYILEPERLACAMVRVAAHLAHDGLFIFDLNTEFALRGGFFNQNNITSEDRLRYHWVSDYFPDSRMCRVRMRFWYRQIDGADRMFEEVHWQYAYRSDEIIAMLEAAGFEDVAVYQAYTLRPPRRNSDRLFYIARRP